MFPDPAGQARGAPLWLGHPRPAHQRWCDIATPYESDVSLSLLLHLLVEPQAQHPQFLVQVVARNTQQFGHLALIVFGARQGKQDCLAFGLGTGLGKFCDQGVLLAELAADPSRRVERG